MFKLHSNYSPSGDQPRAIQELAEDIEKNKKHLVLQGVTGSGKTFTIANLIAKFNRTTLVLSHNKTLASQLYSELKEFFPENRVEYFVSYFDFYRPEAYLPSTDTYIDKTSKTNNELDAMRMSSLNALLTRKDTIVVSSVAAIYGAFNPQEYQKNFFSIEVGQELKRKDFFLDLVKRHYKRNDVNLVPGSFSAKGDVVEIAPAWTSDFAIRVEFFGDEIEAIATIDPLNKTLKKRHKNYLIFPANAYSTNKDIVSRVVLQVKEELIDRLDYFEKNNKLLEMQRLEQRVKSDMDSLEEFGICSGIENYARYIDGREQGEKPYTLLDYLPEEALVFIDESHMMVPQLNAMFNGDRSRKQNLVDYGFRLPSALDNRPLTFSEFEEYKFPKIYISATPSEYEIEKADQKITKMIIRPTGLLDPIIETRSKTNQVEDIYDELQKQKAKNERILILTTTKRFSEELTRYFQEKGEKVAYIHSDHKTFERNEILRKLRKGVYDLVIGINLLREGIDLPEVSLVIILDADKESFLRNTKSLIQIVGRASRNSSGKVIFYADFVSKSMRETIEDNFEKRQIQIQYNKEHGIVPQTIIKDIPEPIEGHGFEHSIEYFLSNEKKSKAQLKEKEKLILDLKKQMLEASQKMNYERAIHLRDLLIELGEKL